MYEPKLLDDNDPKYILPPTDNVSYMSPFYCRLKAVDDVKKLGNPLDSSLASLITTKLFINCFVAIRNVCVLNNNKFISILNTFMPIYRSRIFN